MYYIAMNRKDQKIPKLKDVLQAVIAKEAERAKSKRDKKVDLASLMAEGDNLNDEQYGQLREQWLKIKGAHEENAQQLTLLRSKVDHCLRPRAKEDKGEVKIRKSKRAAPDTDGLAPLAFANTAQTNVDDAQMALNIFAIEDGLKNKT